MYVITLFCYIESCVLANVGQTRANQISSTSTIPGIRISKRCMQMRMYGNTLGREREESAGEEGREGVGSAVRSVQTREETSGNAGYPDDPLVPLTCERR